jgi:DnaJ domain
MDPYQILGLSRGSTREEIKEAFRAHAWGAHPDRGGDELAFVRLCTAYKQILGELDQRPGAEAQPSTTSGNSRRSTAPGSKVRRRSSKRSDGNERTPSAPDPVWEPDLVLLDEPPLEGRPQRPPDPDWQPDMILLEQTIIGEVSHDPRYGWIDHVPWLRHALERWIPEDSKRRSEWASTIRWVIGLILLVVCYWLCLLFLFPM